jgi:predicted acylesterase/phospholipase RssA
MREKELRLALVCYGGISLAVYMHGITKEIWHLARASRAFHDGTKPASESETIYAELLAEIEQTSGLKLRILADIIAGASAGGINGIFLSQAIATGQSLDPLTDLWLEDADVDRLLDPDAKMASRFSKIWAQPLIWAFANRQGADWDDELDPATRDELHDKLTRFIRSRWFEPPFGGAVFTRLLRKAFDAMASLPVGPRLLPEEQPLDLFVTVTDFRGHPETLKLNSPPEISETEHRLTLSFRDAPGDPKTLGDANDLIFAARATASFPGAFPPFTVKELDHVLHEDKRSWPGRDAFLARSLPGRENTILIDGSVLANAPFRPAISALRSRPARREVDRRFVYIDPKPGIRSVQFSREGETSLPGFFTTIFGALSDIPREQPIRDNLDAIAGRSERIRRSRRIIEGIRPEIEAAVDHLFGHTFFLNSPTAARLAKWRATADARAARDSGHAWSAYLRLRVENAGGHQGDAGEYLLAHDIAYRSRRLRFLSRQLAQLAEAHPEIDYEPARLVVFARLMTLFEMHGDDKDLPGFDAGTDAALADGFAQCAKPARRELLLAYLGFPFYDVATYALLQGEGLDEFDTIKVDRISPDEAQSIRKGDATATLKGIQFNSFGAFFSRAYRENDYLWGRLHGAERLIDIIISTLPDTHPLPLPPQKVASLKQSIFNAILDEEALRCAAITPLIIQLRLEVAAMSRLD